MQPDDRVRHEDGRTGTIMEISKSGKSALVEWDFDRYKVYPSYVRITKLVKIPEQETTD